MILHRILGSLALLSLALLIWQWLVARKFPLHQRAAEVSFVPAVTLLKSLKGADAATEDCLRNWFAQDYAGDVQVLFGVADADDPAAAIVRKLQQEFPKREAQLIVCGPPAGPNAKVSKLAELEKLAKHDVWIVSDADVRVPADFLANVVAPLREPETGLVNCFYRLANPATLAMQWEAIAINADFWSQVLQSQSIKPLDFALGAVMATRRQHVEAIGGFRALVDCLADDYQLGNRIARQGRRIALCPVVVECWDPPMDWRAVWKHQLRWARTIRVCQPVPYFFSILSNAGLWAMLLFLVELPFISIQSINGGATGNLRWTGFDVSLPRGLIIAGVCCVLRVVIAHDLQRRLIRSSRHANYFWLVPVKDLLQAAIWLAAFAGGGIEWRGQRFTLRRDGTLVKR